MEDSAPDPAEIRQQTPHLVLSSRSRITELAKETSNWMACLPVLVPSSSACRRVSVEKHIRRVPSTTK